MKQYILLILSSFCLSTVVYSDESVVTMPCLGYETRTDEFNIYGSGYANDTDSINAIRKAKLIARNSIASQIEVLISSVTDIYIETITSNNAIEIQEYFRTVISTQTHQLLIGCQLICQNTNRNSQQQYESSVAMALPVNSILEAIVNQSASAQIDWNNYRKVFENNLNKQP